MMLCGCFVQQRAVMNRMKMDRLVMVQRKATQRLQMLHSQVHKDQGTCAGGCGVNTVNVCERCCVLQSLGCHVPNQERTRHAAHSQRQQAKEAQVQCAADFCVDAG